MSNGDGSKQKENGPAENKEAHKHVGGNTPTDVPTYVFVSLFILSRAILFLLTTITV